MKKSICGLCMLALWLSLSASTVRGAPLLHYQTSWIGNTFGFGQGTWMKIDIRAIAVATDGTVYTNAPWDESGAELSAYRDGKVVAVGYGTHGWGNFGGDAIAINDRYVYAATSIDNEGGHLATTSNWPAKGRQWFGVTRRLRSDISQGAPFDNGMGNFGNSTHNSFLLINDTDIGSTLDASYTKPDSHDDQSPKTAWVTGLAATNRELYVSNYYRNEVLVFDAVTMYPLRKWHVDHPMKLAIDASDGSIWVVSYPKSAAPEVLHFDAKGSLLTDAPDVITLPKGIEPSDIQFASNGQLMLADEGVSQQVLFFGKKDDRYVLVKTVGTKFGILADPKGKEGPLRFDGLTGVGMDGANNLYVAMNSSGLRLPDDAGDTAFGASLESYTPDQSLRWQLQAEAFVSGAEVDRADPKRIYSAVRRFAFDENRPVGKEWSYEATLQDRFQYPTPAPFRDLNVRVTPYIRTVLGRRILYALDQIGNVLTIYRFDRPNGDIAIPSGAMTTYNDLHLDPKKFGDGSGIWRNTSGNGKFAESEWQRDPHPPSSYGVTGAAWWVDYKGGVWLPMTGHGLRYLPVQGIDAVGNPVYDYKHIQDFSLPAPFVRVQRLQYDVDSDTLWVSGYTLDRPYDPVDWKGSGAVLARYDHWLKTSGRSRAAIVFDTCTDMKAHPVESPATFVAEGDYVFTIDVITARVDVFSASTGRLIGSMKPDATVGNMSGWADTSSGISAYRQPDGKYFIITEDDYHGKFIVYRWMPTANERASPIVKAAN